MRQRVTRDDGRRLSSAEAGRLRARLAGVAAQVPRARPLEQAPVPAGAGEISPDRLLRAPVSTYRIQLSQRFTIRDLSALSRYLDTLGVTDCYCSPLLKASPGSTHGYDICNPAELNPELASREDLESLGAELRRRGMGFVLDFVPNHMGIDPVRNLWWRDVLENGPSSPYASSFDIDWRPAKTELWGKVLLPILGDQYGLVLERSELQLARLEGDLVLRYFDRTLPINPRHIPMVLGHGIEALAERLGADQDDLVDFREILSRFAALPGTSERDRARAGERRREKQRAAHELTRLLDRAPEIREHVDAAVRAFNGRPGDPTSFDLLHSVLEMQAYRLAYWRTAFDEINYRRFFDVNDLAGLRMEDPAVFAETHALLLDLVESGLVHGLRIDHPDGLFDPAAYLEELQGAIRGRLGSSSATFYVVAEKILARGERLRDDWRVSGTTGYGFLNTLNGLFVNAEGLGDLRRAYRRFAGHRQLAADTVYESKKFVMRSAMASELNMLALALNRLSESDRRSRDFTLNSLRRALIEVIACFPVYRTYITERGAAAADVAVIDRAIAGARRRNPVQEPSIFDFIRRSLLGRSEAASSFAKRFQQYTAPVVAKGIEDTAFYREVLLLSANEVGGDLRYRTRSAAEFHSENAYRLSRWPFEMTAGSTHDTKLGEDARARIRIISEAADQWRVHVRRWAGLNDASRTRLASAVAPDRNDEWLFYQALAGAWPAEPLDAIVPVAAPHAFVQRMQAYMSKAIKEAKRHTSWLHENADYESAVSRFVELALAGDQTAAFLGDFVPFQRRLAWFGMLGSLAELTLRLGSPGVPDIYQGSELWTLTLVDPDNRQAVDFDARQAMLEELTPLVAAAEDALAGSSSASVPLQPSLKALFDDWPDGRAKLYTLAVALRLRRAHPDLFLRGEYEALGTDQDDPHLVAFARRSDEGEVIVMVPRFLARMMDGVPGSPFGPERWGTASVRLPARLATAKLINVFTGEPVEPVVYRGVPGLLAGSVFQSWPVAMLWRK
jgi:(1->4)-alpha-D-glucan 1-alpha-D-glucosylmutase